MNSIVLSNIVRFTCLLLAQVLIFNNIDLFTFINPYPYILFIILYPVNGNKALFYLSSFLMGLCIDIFENSGGVNAAAALILAFSRPSILKFSFGISYEYHNLNIYKKVTNDIFKSLEVFGYLAICILIHHVVLFTLEFLRFDFILELAIRIILTFFATLVTCILIIFLLKPARK